MIHDFLPTFKFNLQVALNNIKNQVTHGLREDLLKKQKSKYKATEVFKWIIMFYPKLPNTETFIELYYQRDSDSEFKIKHT